MSGVGDVSDIADLVTDMLQVTVNDIEGDEGTGMSQMAFPAHGGAAHIHAHMAFGERLEQFFLPGIGIIEFEGGHRNVYGAKLP